MPDDFTSSCSTLLLSSAPRVNHLLLRLGKLWLSGVSQLLHCMRLQAGLCQDYISGLAVTPDGQYVLASSADSHLRLLDLRRPGTVLAESACSAALQCCAADNEVAVAGADDGQVGCCTCVMEVWAALVCWTGRLQLCYVCLCRAAGQWLHMVGPLYWLCVQVHFWDLNKQLGRTPSGAQRPSDAAGMWAPWSSGHTSPVNCICLQWLTGPSKASPQLHFLAGLEDGTLLSTEVMK